MTQGGIDDTDHKRRRHSHDDTTDPNRDYAAHCCQRQQRDERRSDRTGEAEDDDNNPIKERRKQRQRHNDKPPTTNERRQQRRHNDKTATTQNTTQLHNDTLRTTIEEIQDVGRKKCDAGQRPHEATAIARTIEEIRLTAAATTISPTTAATTKSTPQRQRPHETQTGRQRHDSGGSKEEQTRRVPPQTTPRNTDNDDDDDNEEDDEEHKTARRQVPRLDPTRRTTKPKGCREWIWQGKVFGTHVTSLIDYIVTDRRTARRADQGWTRRWLAFPTDHLAIGQTLSLKTWRWNEAERMCRCLPKPIGWTLDEARRQQWEAKVKEGADAWKSSWDVTHINEFVQQLTSYGKGTNKKRRGTSAAEDNIKKALAYTHNDVDRAKLRQRQWHERKRIRREKSETHFTQVLHNLRNGGWGKKDMEGRKEGMTQLRLPDGTTTSHKTTIAEQATKYYKTLFDIEAATPTNTTKRGRDDYTGISTRSTTFSYSRVGIHDGDGLQAARQPTTTAARSPRTTTGTTRR